MPLRCTAFDGQRLVASGDPADVALKAKAVVERTPSASLLVFDDETGDAVEFDLRGSDQDVLSRIAARTAPDRQPEAPRGPGRPKLGVVAREVTLLPRHWDWLSGQPGGASVALRRLVDEARRANEGRDRIRRAREATFRFASALAGDATGFEEAMRALFAGDRTCFDDVIEAWPDDVRAHTRKLAATAFSDNGIGEGA